MRLGAGSFKTLHRAASPSTEAFASIRSSCYAPITTRVAAVKPPRAMVNQAEREDSPYREEYGSAHRRRARWARKA